LFRELETHWQIGKVAAQSRLKKLIDQGLGDYKEGRNFSYYL